MMRKALTVLAPLALGLALSACQQKDKAPEAPASAAPDAKPGVAVADARLVLPAVKGNPGVAYFTLANSDTKAVALAAVAVDGVGKAEMHQTVGGKMGPVDRVDIDPNASVSFAPGGLHVMAMEPSADWQPGGTVNVTVILSDGTSQTVAAAVRAAGDDR